MQATSFDRQLQRIAPRTRTTASDTTGPSQPFPSAQARQRASPGSRSHTHTHTRLTPPPPPPTRYARFSASSSTWDCLSCPTDDASLLPAAYCPGARYLPVPERGYWVDRRDLKLAGNLYRCAKTSTSGDTRDPRCGVLDEDTPTQAWRGLSAKRQACWRREVLLNRTLADACTKGNGGGVLDTSCIENSGGLFCSECVNDEFPVYSSSARKCVACGGSSLTPVVALSAAWGPGRS